MKPVANPYQEKRIFKVAWGILFLAVLHLGYGIWLFFYDSQLSGFLFGVLCVAECLWFLLILLLLKAHRPKRKTAITLCALYFVILLLSSAFSAYTVFTCTDENTANADYVIVMGYGLKEDKITETLTYRLESAYQYLQENPQAVVIVSGYRSGKNTISEAEAMSRWQMEKGIATNRIIKEEAATNTKENIANCKPFLSGKVIIISSNYHIFRIRMFCLQEDVTASMIGAKADMKLLPSALLHEQLSLLKWFVLGQE